MTGVLQWGYSDMLIDLSSESLSPPLLQGTLLNTLYIAKSGKG